MHSEKIIASLEHFGFSKVDAQIYLFLLSNGRQRATNIAETLNIPKATVYKSLSRLENKKAITVKRENAKLFSARSVEYVTREQIAIKKIEASDLEKYQKKIS